MSRFGNSKIQPFLDAQKACSLDDDENDLSIRCKFNFSYFEVQDCSQNFCDWTPDQLHKLLEKLKAYSRHPLEYWQGQVVGRGRVLSIYDEFPKKTDFTRPRHVPHQACWGRFRLESAVRMVGFVVPDNYAGKPHPQTKVQFDRNTFYVVYLDKDHRFYKMEKK